MKLSANQQRKIDEIIESMSEPGVDHRGSFDMIWGGIRPEQPNESSTIKARVGTADGSVFTLVTHSVLLIGTPASVHYKDKESDKWVSRLGVIKRWRTGLREEDKANPVYISQFVLS